MIESCIDADTAAAFTAHTLPPSDAAKVNQHIDSCSLCRVLISELARADWASDSAAHHARRHGQARWPRQRWPK